MISVRILRFFQKNAKMFGLFEKLNASDMQKIRQGRYSPRISCCLRLWNDIKNKC